MFYAQEEAQRYGEGYVSTEHLLLGLCREQDSSAAQIIGLFGFELSRVKAEVEKMAEPDYSRPSYDMTLTPRAKQAIDLAEDEAFGLDHNFIGTEHLLLGLIREGEGIAGKVLAKLNIDLERARTFTLDVQGETKTGRTADSRRVSYALMHRLLGRAWTIAEATEENVVRSEHILRALAEEETGLAADILTEHGLTPTVIDEEVTRRRREP